MQVPMLWWPPVKLFLLPLHNHNYTTVMNLYINIWYAGYVKGSVYRQGFGTHRLENNFPKSWKNSKCLWRGQTMCRSCCKGPHLLNCVSHFGFVPESSFLGDTGDCCVSQVCTLHNDPSHRSKCHTCVSHTPAPGHRYCHLEGEVRSHQREQFQCQP